MLRIHFTDVDLGRLRIATGPDAMWETVLSLHHLVSPSTFFGPWQRVTRRALAEARLGQDVHLLTALSPISAYFPDFLTPAGPVSDFGAGVEEVLSTSRSQLREEITLLADGRTDPPAWLDDISAGRSRALRRLGVALRRYHAVALAPYRTTVAAHIDRETTRHTERALGDGTEAVLGRLGPRLRWRPPVLEADYPFPKEIRLDGRGLCLVPSFFINYYPITLADPDLTPVLVYPVTRGPVWVPERCGTTSRRDDPLAELLGATRAALLRLLDEPATTTVLATRAHTSPSSVSRHTGALRRAGLVASDRRGMHVLHVRTSLGTALVHGR
ncbi:winged helix-turn-helix domain-containing protein [Streptomyces chumphonensis]